MAQSDPKEQYKEAVLRTLKRRILESLDTLGVEQIGKEGNPYRWSKSDFATDLASELFKRLDLGKDE